MTVFVIVDNPLVCAEVLYPRSGSQCPLSQQLMAILFICIWNIVRLIVLTRKIVEAGARGQGR
jgi:hypothetical protein